MKPGRPEPAETAPLLDLTVRRKTFGDQPILADIAFRMQPGEVLSLVGPSGCGKSTLLRIIAGLDTRYDGRVCVRGEAPRLHSRHVGLIFQEPRLMPWLTVAENVGFELGRAARRDARVAELLLEVGLADHASAWPKQLSGGMAQRAAIARGLFSQPALLLLDEPFSAVDALTRMRLQDLLLSIAVSHGTTLLMVTHDVSEAIYLSDRVLVLHSGAGPMRGEVRIAAGHPRDRRDPELVRHEASVMRLLADTHALNAASATPMRATAGRFTAGLN